MLDLLRRALLDFCLSDLLGYRQGHVKEAETVSAKHLVSRDYKYRLSGTTPERWAHRHPVFLFIKGSIEEKVADLKQFHGNGKIFAGKRKIQTADGFPAKQDDNLITVDLSNEKHDF